MRKKIRLSIAVFVAILLLMSVFVGMSMNPSNEDDDMDIVLARTTEQNDLEYLEKLGANVLHSYDAFTLLELDPDEIQQVESRGITIDMMEHRTTLEVGFGQYEFDIEDGEPEISDELRIDGYESDEKGQYLIHMLGPIAPEWRTRIEDQGVEVMNYVPNYAYRVRMTPDQAEAVEDLDFVDWTGIYHPEYKIQPGVEPGMVNVRLVPGAERDSVDEVINTVPVISSEDLQDRGSKITAEVDSQETLRELASITDVNHISKDVEVKLLDEMATQIIGGGTWFYPENWEPGDNAYRNSNLPGDYAGDAGSYMNQLGYTGDGVEIAIADSGLGDGSTPDAGHDDFTGRVLGGYTFGSGGWEDGHGHGTHVAGSVAGDTFYGKGEGYGFDDYYAAQGSAPKAELYVVQIFENGGSVVPDDTLQIFEVAKQNSDAYVHSNSWGSTGDHNLYGEHSENFDIAVRDSNRDTDYNEPMVIPTAAGNEGTDGVPPPGSAKNNIVVGATENYNSESDNPENIATFSSRGFVDDNRIKPDITAPGADIYSTEPGNSYQYMSGTSMATPAVSGASAVFVEWYEDNFGVKPSPALVRGLLINTANPLSGNSGTIPNGDEGWGMVDISKLERPTDDPLPFEFVDQESLLETGDVDEHTITASDVDEPLKITLTWTDKEAPADTGSGTALMNDLNLEVVSPSGDVYNGNAFASDAGEESTADYTYPNTDTMGIFDDSGDGLDDTNNVENVFIPQDEVEMGAYTINVEGFNIPEDGTNDGDQNQDYALTGYNVADGPQINIESPLGGEYWEAGQEKEIRWDTGESAGTITGVDLEYSVDGGSTWDYIVEDHDDTGSYLWTVPNQLTDQAVIRATVHDDINGTDPGTDTSGEFTITDVAPPEVTLTSPTGGEVWNAGDDEDITWDSTQGDEPIEGVDIEYSTDGGDTWNTIVDGTDDTGEYTWMIPDETTSEALVRVWVHCQGGTSGDDISEEFDLVGYPPQSPSNLDVDQWSEEFVELFYDDASEDKGYQTWDTDPAASTWDIRNHGSAVGDNSWDWGDDDFDYGIAGESRLISPEIEIPEENVLDAELTFQHWVEFDGLDRYHGANLRISTDGPNGTFELIEPEGGYPDTINDEDGNPLGGEPGWAKQTDWESVTFDLSEYVGQSVHLRWNVGTCDVYSTRGGYRIDDIMVSFIEQGTDHNQISWNAGDGDELSSIDSYETDNEVVRDTGDSDTLFEVDNKSSSAIETQNTELLSKDTVRHEDDWHSLYGHIETDENDVEWRYEMGNAMGWDGESGLQYYTAMLINPPDYETNITDVALYHTPLGNPPHIVQAQAFIGLDNGGAPADPWLAESEIYDGEGTGWMELSLNDEVETNPNETYWIVVQYEEDGDGKYPQAFVHEDDASPEDNSVSHASYITEPMTGHPGDPNDWMDYSDQHGAWGIEARMLPSIEDDYFQVDIKNYDEQAFPGETVNVDYSVTNVGESSGTQDIEFYVEGALEDTEAGVTLGADDVYNGTFSWETSKDLEGYYDLSISSEDSDDGVSVEVGTIKDISHYNIYRSENPDGPWDEANLVEQVDADGSASYNYVDEGKGELDDTYWWYVVRAVSEDGVEEENTDAVQEPGAETSLFDISLTTDTQADDWNFVSFNLIPNNSGLTEILDDSDYGISGSYDKVMYYDAETDEWQSYIPGRDAHFNGLNSWDHTMGVWIQMNADDTLTVEGTEPTSTDITLQPGWNMVSYPGSVSGTGVPDHVTQIGHFDASQENNLAYTDQVDTFEFEPGQGYWIYAEEQVQWTVEY